MESSINKREAWNKGKLVGQKPPLKPKDIWAIRIHLQRSHAVRNLALFNLAIDSKLRGCDLVNLHVRDVTHGNQVLPRAMVIQRKTQRPVQFELTEPTRAADQHGSRRRTFVGSSTSSQAGLRVHLMCRLGSTPALCIIGQRLRAWIPWPMAPIRCDEPRPPSSTSGRRT